MGPALLFKTPHHHRNILLYTSSRCLCTSLCMAAWKFLHCSSFCVTINLEGLGVMRMLLRYALISQHWPNESQEVIVRLKAPLHFSFSSPISLQSSKSQVAVDGWAPVNMAPLLIKSSGTPVLLCCSDCAVPAVVIKAKTSSMKVFYSPI